MEDNGRGGVIVFDLVDALNGSDPNASAVQLKTKFQLKGTSLGGETPNAGGLVVDEDIGVDTLTTQCYVEAVVHGSLTADQFSEPATLLILQFAFCPRSRSRRFRDVAITLTFTAGTELAIQPANRWKTGTSSIDRERSHTISPSLEGSVGPATGTLSYEWKQTDSRKIEDHIWIEGVVKALEERPDGRRVPDSAVWELYENKQTSSGVPSFFRTAVLLKRESTLRNEPFKAMLSITGDVHTHPSDWAKIRGIKDGNGPGNSHQASSGLRKLHKSQPDADPDDENTVPMVAAKIPLYFDPGLPDLNPLGLDKTQLQNVDLSQYKSLVHVRSWTESVEEAGQSHQGQGQAQTQAQGPVVAPAPIPTPTPTTAPPPSRAIPKALPVVSWPSTTLPAAQPPVAQLPVAPLPPASNPVYTAPTVSELSTVGQLDTRLAQLAAELSLVDEEAQYLRRMIELVAEKRRLLQETHFVQALRNNASDSK
ncbi:hypothetical protein SCUCBS95973_001765 [Sporothrix curviconia]|uniref:Uncharacterized protein n=1 Tax=Sporothrix curviconia TaxID=1260050 RepID=A0ABP0B1E1_9PEZI